MSRLKHVIVAIAISVVFVVFCGCNKETAGTISATKDVISVITKAGSYELSGEIGSQIYIEVGKDEDVELKLNGAIIKAPDGPAIYMKKGGTLKITLVEGSHNEISDSTVYSNDYNMKGAAIFSKGDVILSGVGDVNITGNNYHGIKSKKSVIFESGTYNIKCETDGAHADDEVIVNGGAITIESGDDGLQSSAMVTINGGITNINSKGDGVDSNGNINMTGGELLISGPVTEVDSALDYDMEFVMTGGRLVAGGSTKVYQGLSDSSTVHSIYVGIPGSWGQVNEVRNKDGEVVLTYSPHSAYECVLLCADDWKEGDVLSVYADDELLGTVTLKGLTTVIEKR